MGHSSGERCRVALVSLHAGRASRKAGGFKAYLVLYRTTKQRDPVYDENALAAALPDRRAGVERLHRATHANPDRDGHPHA
ncbi:MAG: hypothetical protein Kow00120_02350 [Anaerolineae bacterium]